MVSSPGAPHCTEESWNISLGVSIAQGAGVRDYARRMRGERQCTAQARARQRATAYCAFLHSVYSSIFEDSTCKQFHASVLNTVDGRATAVVVLLQIIQHTAQRQQGSLWSAARLCTLEPRYVLSCCIFVSSIKCHYVGAGLISRVSGFCLEVPIITWNCAASSPC
eukprot:1792049-Pleurochrysis_carterae.AAC.1